MILSLVFEDLGYGGLIFEGKPVFPSSMHVMELVANPPEKS
jgi:hypothetical protein